MSRSLPPPDTVRPQGLRLLAGLATAVLIASTATACTDKKANQAEPSTPTPTTAIPVTVKVSRVAGTLKPAARARIARKVATPLQEYVDNALLGDYPRTNFATAFASFTKGAAKQARRDRSLLTGADFAGAQSVTARSLKAKLSVLSPGGKPAGATARVRFVLDVDGQPVKMAGRLLLTQVRGTWRIFGYDLHRNDVAATAAAEGEG